MACPTGRAVFLDTDHPPPELFDLIEEIFWAYPWTESERDSAEWFLEDVTNWCLTGGGSDRAKAWGRENLRIGWNTYSAWRWDD